MTLHWQDNCLNIDFNAVRELLKSVDMGYYDADKHQQAFLHSAAVTFVFDGQRLIGCGRAISDGVYSAAMYDIVVSADYQGHGLGKMLVQRLMDKLTDCNIILFASPGKEVFYQKLGFRKMLTGMARFTNAPRMIQRGFVEK